MCGVPSVTLKHPCHTISIFLIHRLDDAVTCAGGWKWAVGFISLFRAASLPPTHNLMAVAMRDLFQLFKYYSCCQGDKDIIVLELFQGRRKGFCRHASEGYNAHTSWPNSVGHVVHIWRASSIATVELNWSTVVCCDIIITWSDCIPILGDR